MRYAILSDIHANLAALEAVLDDLKERGIDELWCLGDTVGYGPSPNECIELLRSFENFCIAGNHDWGSTGKISISEFNQDAAFACQWTKGILTAENAGYLRNLPEIVERDDITMAHGSPRRPIWEYIMNSEEARENLPYFKTPFCLVGHTHISLVFHQGKRRVPVFRHLDDGEEIALSEGRYIINPGSVGQPRDGDPRGSYAVYDAEAKKVTLYRVPYDIAQTQQRMREEGLPRFLIERLSQGI
jgi:predicted phosphodiesterase